jgi:hypothetical protein
MEALLTLTVILCAVIVSFGLGLLAIRGFLNLLSRFMPK